MAKRISGDRSWERVAPRAEGLSRREFMKKTALSGWMLGWTDKVRAGVAAESIASEFAPGPLANSHDLLSLPDWGPYSKKYFGISHIPDVSRGLSFDLSIFPLLCAGPVKLPSVLDEEAGVHPWEAAPALEFYALRMEMIGKDQVYCDVSFSQMSEQSRLVRLTLVNQTPAPHAITLNCLAQLVFPPVKPLSSEPVRLCDVQLPPGAVWVDAVNYADLQFARPRPTDNLVPDGQWRAEERGQGYVSGSVVAREFGKDAGDRVCYRLRLERPFSHAVLIWRFQQKEQGDRVTFKLEGSARAAIDFPGGTQLGTVAVPLGQLPAGPCELRFTSLGGTPVALDGFALVEAALADQLRFVEKPWHAEPQTATVPNHGLLLNYQDTTECYGFSLGQPWAGNRELKWRELDAAFGAKSGPNTLERIFGNRQGHRAGDPDSLFIHAFTPPFALEPNSRRVVYGVVCAGSDAEVRRCLAGFDAQSPDNERVYRSTQEKVFHPVSTPQGESFKFSQQMMAALTLTNVTYPLYTQKQYIRHYSPGRAWDCLYTWDAGFVGLGLLELDHRPVVDTLNAYTTPLQSQSAFIHHGTPVPTQIYLFGELWNRTQSRELLEYFYPRLRQFHLFMAGRLGSSTTRQHRDHLICTWDYFYNTGGWDDYPPQVYVHQNKLTAKVAPVANSSHTIRCAKLLRQAAEALGRAEDFNEYDQDIAQLSASLQEYSWDSTSGYFGYVMHDEHGEPTGILRDSHGANFNMGLDGIYPLVAGICSHQQEQMILKRLFSPQHLWMDVGITTVDQSAPYYRPDGYWNGSVWFAHQWFLWKTMLDLGRADLALRIAQTGLNVWKQATDSTHDCYEYFKPSPPIGRGWHQFTSLSSPTLAWFASLYTPGRLTCGFEVWMQECRFAQDNRHLTAKLKSGSTGHREFSVLACMNPDSRYQVRWNGTRAKFATLHDALLQIQLPYEAGPGELIVTRI
jgi:hypothetical protein